MEVLRTLVLYRNYDYSIISWQITTYVIYEKCDMIGTYEDDNKQRLAKTLNFIGSHDKTFVVVE